MKKFIASIIILVMAVSCNRINDKTLGSDGDERMEWWREARFGMFIHWGLYSVPAGEWEGSTNHAEWIRTTARIPIETYDQYVDQFNPTKFDATEWVSMAKNAGMKYIVITSKHHDGFCLFNSDYTEFDIMSTPFKRDIMKELSEACRDKGIKICWYHSIMDWHHPDYLPRRGWETDRLSEGAEFGRYIEYMKGQLAELLTNYREIGVLWFDGEWEDTWTHEMGVDLYDYVKGMQESIIINNRVDKGRRGMEGMTKPGEFRGDFGTPEQEIPATGLPGIDWETCMTMNNHWGYNSFDNNWKTEEDLIRKLADIASKGGNFLLNIGPKSDGTFPQESIDRLKTIGDWMSVYGESIYGTGASLFEELPWGRSTHKTIGKGTRIYLHVFDWPQDLVLSVPALDGKPVRAYNMGGMKKLKFESDGSTIKIILPDTPPDKYNSVIILDVK